MKIRHRELLFAAFSLFAGSVCAVLLGEVLLRLVPAFARSYDALRYRHEGPAVTGPNDYGYLRPSKLLGYELLPNARIPGMDAQVNSYGLMGREYPLQKAPGNFRILLLGDSIAWQDGTRAALEKLLNEDPRLGGRNFEIWNSGTPSYDVRRYALLLEERGLAWDPDLVLIFIFLNDFTLNLNFYYKSKAGVEEFHFPLEELRKHFTPDPRLLRHSYLYRFLLLRANAVLASRARTDDVPRGEVEGRRYLGRIQELCRKRGLPVAAVIFPYLTPAPGWKDWQDQQYGEIRKVLGELGFASLDLRPFCERLMARGVRIRQQPLDDMHPTYPVQALIAREIKNRLLGPGTGLLKSSD